MSRPPRPPNEPLFGARQIALAAVQGFVLFAAVLAFYGWTLQSGPGEGEARAAAFVALMSGHLSLAVAESSTSGARLFARERLVFWAIVAAAALVLALAVTVPFLVGILRFSTPPGGMLLASVGVGILAGGWYGLFAMRARGRQAAPVVSVRT